MFAALREWAERRRALRELRAVKGQSNKPFRSFFSEQIDLAQTEFNVGRSQTAAEIWYRMHAQFPDLCLTSEKALNLFIDLGKLDEADALIADGRKRYPRYRSLYAAAFARCAFRRGEPEEALRRYEIVRREFPQVADVYGIAAACLNDLGRDDEAEAMLTRGIRKLPNNFDLCMRYAQAAERRRDWAEALERWTTVSHRFKYLPGPLGTAQSLRELRRFAEAEQVLADACLNFRTNPYDFVALAELASAKGDVDQAIRQWEVVLFRFPWFDRAYIACAQLMREIECDGDADELLRRVVTRSPTYLPGYLEYAKSAQRRGDTAEAAERWKLVRDRFPDCAEVHGH